MVAVTHVSPVNYSTVASDGTATITVLCGQFIWIVYHKTVTMKPTKTTPPVVNLYRNQANPEMLLDYTVNGNGDASDSKHILFPGDSFIAVWSGGTSGSQVALRIEALQFAPNTPLDVLAGLL